MCFESSLIYPFLDIYNSIQNGSPAQSIKQNEEYVEIINLTLSGQWSIESLITLIHTYKYTHMHPGGSLRRTQPQGLVCEFQNDTLSLQYWSGLSNPFQSMTVVRIVNLIQIPNSWNTLWKGNPLHIPHIHALLVNILACLDVIKMNSCCWNKPILINSFHEISLVYSSTCSQLSF